MKRRKAVRGDEKIQDVKYVNMLRLLIKASCKEHTCSTERIQLRLNNYKSARRSFNKGNNVKKDLVISF